MAVHKNIAINIFLNETLYRKYNPFWYNHDSPEVRRQSNQDFRYREKIYFKKHLEHLIKTKDRGWRTW